MDIMENILRNEPFVSYYYQLFTPMECNYVINNSNEFQPSLNYNRKEGKSEKTPIRTSSSFFDMNNKFQFVKQRVFETVRNKFWYLNNFSFQNLENIQIQRYEPGQEYKPHTDFFNKPNDKVLDNDRIATAILYLNDNFSGGETYFPNLKLKIQPEQGSLLYFEYKYLYNLNYLTIHQGLPVIEGSKYIMTFWFRHQPYDYKSDKLTQGFWDPTKPNTHNTQEK